MGSSANGRRWIAKVGAVALAAGVVWGPAAPAGAEPTPSRVFGADRYATAAEISEAHFAPGVSAVFVATGEAFPDALAAAPAAALAGGPVLLTKPGSLPTSTANELDRLDPGRIVVLGGPTAVGTAVEDQLGQYTAGSVTRIEGATRWNTAANVSAATFDAGVDTVFVATGNNFPDALAGGPAAVNAPGEGAPVLLVEQGSIPQATRVELDRLDAQQVVILGGPGAVSQGVRQGLEAYSEAPVARIEGDDRYLTSVAISEATFEPADGDTVYLATGENFPDAVAAGSPAGLEPGPVLLAKRTCVPAEVNAEIDRLDPSRLVVLGGETALSNAVLTRSECSDTPQPQCHPSYPQACLDPDAIDYDCLGSNGDGPSYVPGPIPVGPDDPFDLDPDDDGIGCEIEAG